MVAAASVGRGLGKALLTLRHRPYGQVLLVIVAAGLVVFGIYGLCECPLAPGLTPAGPLAGL